MPTTHPIPPHRSHSPLRPLRAAALLLLAAAFAITACTDNAADARRAAADSLMTALSQQRAYDRMLTTADSLHKAGAMLQGQCYFWQGQAAYRLSQPRMAEFYWQEAMNATADKTDAADIECYARAASYLASSQCRNLDFSAALKTAGPAALRLDKLQADTTSDYNNLLIFVGCSQMHFHADTATIYSLFNRAYNSHLDNIARKANREAYRDAVAGLINIAYGWIGEREYEQGLTWTERFGSLIEDYGQRFPEDSAYIDKQAARHLIFSATALEGMGRRREAAASYAGYQRTRFAKTFEGLTDAAGYLTLARRWDEAVLCYRDLNEHLTRSQTDYTLEIIQMYLLKKYNANTMAGQRDTADAVSNHICQLLDSAIIRSRQLDAEEQKAIREKEMEMAQQQLEMSRMRLMNTIVALIVIVVVFLVFTYIRQRHAQQLAEKNEQLSALNSQLSTVNSQLTLANARAQESSHMKSVFIQQISHEIRTPLNILSGFTQVLTTPDMELDADTRADINREITQNTERITRLVNKMLELSDAGSKSVIERTDNVPALQIAAEAIDASGISNAKHLTFDIDLTPEAEDAILLTKRQSAVRALSLVLDNARKFTAPPEAQQAGDAAKGATVNAPSAKAVLRIELVEEQIRFIVEDTGIGVPPDEADHIFEEFVQLDDYYDGTGIGLTVARSLAQRLGGDITLDTSYSPGARFIMSLPA